MNTEYLGIKISLLVHLYMAWYYACILGLVNDDENISEDYLRNHSRLDMDIVCKFKEMYNKWVGFDMDCVENDIPSVKPEEWIKKHWDD